MEWIAVKDKLPEKDAPYLVYGPTADPEVPYFGLGWYDPKFGWSLLPTLWIHNITHWMAIEPPR